MISSLKIMEDEVKKGVIGEMIECRKGNFMNITFKETKKTEIAYIFEVEMIKASFSTVSIMKEIRCSELSLNKMLTLILFFYYYSFLGMMLSDPVVAGRGLLIIYIYIL